MSIDHSGHDSLVKKCMDASYLIDSLYKELEREKAYKESYLDNLNTIFTAQANQAKQSKIFLNTLSINFTKTNKTLKKLLNQKGK